MYFVWSETARRIRLANAWQYQTARASRIRNVTLPLRSRLAYFTGCPAVSFRFENCGRAAVIIFLYVLQGVGQARTPYVLQRTTISEMKSRQNACGTKRDNTRRPQLYRAVVVERISRFRRLQTTPFCYDID